MFGLPALPGRRERATAACRSLYHGRSTRSVGNDPRKDQLGDSQLDSHRCVRRDRDLYSGHGQILLGGRRRGGRPKSGVHSMRYSGVGDVHTVYEWSTVTTAVPVTPATVKRESTEVYLRSLSILTVVHTVSRSINHSMLSLEELPFQIAVVY